jgi:hypothetical protein
MTDYGTIKIPREEYERHNERRQELDQTWAEYIDGEAPELGMHVELDGAVATAEDIKDLQVLIEQLPRNTAEELEGRIR